jgi:hypothetical protein
MWRRDEFWYFGSNGEEQDPGPPHSSLNISCKKTNKNKGLAKTDNQQKIMLALKIPIG